MTRIQQSKQNRQRSSNRKSVAKTQVQQQIYRCSVCQEKLTIITGEEHIQDYHAGDAFLYIEGQEEAI